MGKHAQHCSGCRLPSLIPRLPFLPALPSPPPPPVLVPGRGLIGLQEFVDTTAPALSAAEEIYLQSLTELLRSQLGEQSLPGQLDQILTHTLLPISGQSLWSDMAVGFHPFDELACKSHVALFGYVL